MKRILLVAVAFCGFVSIASAQTVSIERHKSGTKTTASKTSDAAANVDDKEIHWLNIDELQTKMREHPKKVYMDVYTDWCGWCKRMEATTFQNPNVIRYLNENFYCIRFNAERKDTIRFMGKSYYFDPQSRANTLAVELMHGQMSYPTSIYMEEMFMNPQPVPGYQDVPTMEMILKYMGGNLYKSENFQQYRENFKATWQ